MRNAAISAMIFTEGDISKQTLERVFTVLSDLNGESVDPANGKTGRPPVEWYRTAPNEEFYLVAIGHEELLVTPNTQAGRLRFRANLDYPDWSSNHAVIKLIQNIVEKCLAVIDTWWYAFIDLAGDPPPKLYSSIRGAHLRWLFWANYWSRGYLEKADLALRSLPKPSAKPLPGDGLKYMTRKWPDEQVSKAESQRIQLQLGGKGRVSIYIPGPFDRD
jgi:hypothetical protein